MGSISPNHRNTSTNSLFLNGKGDNEENLILQEPETQVEPMQGITQTSMAAAHEGIVYPFMHLHSVPNWSPDAPTNGQNQSSSESSSESSSSSSHSLKDKK